VATTLIITVLADTPAWPANYPERIRSEQEAKKLPPKARVAFACKTCKTVSFLSSVEVGSFLAWLTAFDTHDCPGCGGNVVLKKVEGPLRSVAPYYTHRCSKCGDNSAFLCASHTGSR
jgi:hypothetical protein